MTDIKALIERLETYADPHEEIGMTYARAAEIALDAGQVRECDMDVPGKLFSEDLW